MSDPNVGVPDADVVYHANVRVRAPEVCGLCGGERWIERVVPWPTKAWPDNAIVVEVPCLTCSCQICGSPTDVIGGECGQCHDEADRYESRKEASR